MNLEEIRQKYRKTERQKDEKTEIRKDRKMKRQRDKKTGLWRGVRIGDKELEEEMANEEAEAP